MHNQIEIFYYRKYKKFSLEPNRNRKKKKNLNSLNEFDFYNLEFSFECTNSGRGLNPFPKPRLHNWSVCGQAGSENPKRHDGPPSI